MSRDRSLVTLQACDHLPRCKALPHTDGHIGSVARDPGSARVPTDIRRTGKIAMQTPIVPRTPGGGRSPFPGSMKAPCDAVSVHRGRRPRFRGTRR
jgi:hypothetical protein